MKQEEKEINQEAKVQGEQESGYETKLYSLQAKYNELQKKLNDYEQKDYIRAKEANDQKIKDAEKNKDIKTINENWERQFKEAKERYEKEIQMKNSYIEKQLIDNVAINLANEISTAPDLIMPHIKQRLTVEFVDENPVTKVLDINGSMSPYSVEDLKKEIVSDKKFAQVIKSNNQSDRGFQLAQPTVKSNRVDLNGMYSPQMNPNVPPNELLRRQMSSKEHAEERLDRILSGSYGSVR